MYCKYVVGEYQSSIWGEKVPTENVLSIESPLQHLLAV